MIPAIALDRVRFARGARAILDGIDLRVAPGERVAVLGANGAGKSTLLDIVVGLARAEGRVRVLGRVPPARGVGFLCQDPGASLLPWLSVRDNVELPLRLRGVAPTERARALDETRAQIDPDGRIDLSRSPRALSGGERQLVALMRAWVGAPELVVLDEPLSAVDPLERPRVHEALARASAQALGTTLLLVTHDLDEAAALVDRALVLADARIVADLPVHGDSAALAQAMRRGGRAGAADPAHARGEAPR